MRGVIEISAKSASSRKKVHRPKKLTQDIDGSLLALVKVRHSRWQFLRPFEPIFRDAEILQKTARHIFTPGENIDIVPNVLI